jgi:hypothetical protein
MEEIFMAGKKSEKNFRELSDVKCEGLDNRCPKKIKQKLVDIKTTTPTHCFGCWEREVVKKALTRKQRKLYNQGRMML